MDGWFKDVRCQRPFPQGGSGWLMFSKIILGTLPKLKDLDRFLEELLARALSENLCNISNCQNN